MLSPSARVRRLSPSARVRRWTYVVPVREGEEIVPVREGGESDEDVIPLIRLASCVNTCVHPQLV